MAPPFVDHLECMRCGRNSKHGLDGPCPRCGPEGVLEIVFDVRAARRSLNRRTLRTRPKDMWRYRELLPVSPRGATPPQPVGWTPIISAPRLAAWAGVGSLMVKDEGRNPTASFKDRASAAKDEPKGGMWPKDVFETLLAQPGAAGIRIYHGKGADSAKHMVMVAVDAAGEDMTAGTIMEKEFPCPPFCPSASPLQA